MNVKILEESTTRHHEFPITDHKVFLWLTPLLRHFQVVCPRLWAAYLRVASTEGSGNTSDSNVEEETRRYAARLLGAQEGEIAFVSSTSLGLSMVASGISWRKDDNVVIGRWDFPIQYYPWLNLAAGRRGKVYS